MFAFGSRIPNPPRAAVSFASIIALIAHLWNPGWTNLLVLGFAVASACVLQNVLFPVARLRCNVVEGRVPLFWCGQFPFPGYPRTSHVEFQLGFDSLPLDFSFQVELQFLHH